MNKRMRIKLSKKELEKLTFQGELVSTTYFCGEYEKWSHQKSYGILGFMNENDEYEEKIIIKEEDWLNLFKNFSDKTHIIKFTFNNDPNTSLVPNRIDDNFMRGAENLEELNNLPDWVDEIGDGFLQSCSTFNQPLDLSSITSIGGSFLGYCSLFNQPLDLSNVTYIGTSFLVDCNSFNQSLNISNITSANFAFLQGCSSFNQPLDLSNVTHIDSDFMGDCSSFNQSLDISNVTSIGDDFFIRCSTFNHPLDLSNVTSIGVDFLLACSSFNQPLDISNVTSIGENFLFGCDKLNNVINVGGIRDILIDGGYALSTNDVSAPIYVNGVRIKGEGAQGFMDKLPNSDVNPYRKLILAEEE